MKPIEELNISPWPWSYVYQNYVAPFADHGSDYHYVNEAGGSHVVSSVSCEGDEQAIADARLIAAAPELYDCLREAVEDRCRSCKASWYGKCVTTDGKDCEVVARWKSVLAKAAGEEEL